MKLLVADDDRMVHEMMDDYFGGHYEVLHTYDGAETLMTAVSEKPDALLLDIMMPLLDGRTICQRIKSHPDTQHMKVIMVTGKREQHDRLLGFEVGADDYVEKPFTLEYLGRVIRKFLG
jgi:DNA-binding response OmpR family regulator